MGWGRGRCPRGSRAKRGKKRANNPHAAAEPVIRS